MRGNSADTEMAQVEGDFRGYSRSCSTSGWTRVGIELKHVRRKPPTCHNTTRTNVSLCSHYAENDHFPALRTDKQKNITQGLQTMMFRQRNQGSKLVKSYHLHKHTRQIEGQNYIKNMTEKKQNTVYAQRIESGLIISCHILDVVLTFELSCVFVQAVRCHEFRPLISLSKRDCL